MDEHDDSPVQFGFAGTYSQPHQGWAQRAGGSVSRVDFSWLYPVGKDSEAGPGLIIPADAIAATLTIEHWYDTVPGEDGGQVVIDASADGQDVFIPLQPVGGYPGLPLTGTCNALTGQPAFQGSSGGWVQSSFDLMSYKGGVFYLAFVFGSDRQAAAFGAAQRRTGASYWVWFA